MSIFVCAIVVKVCVFNGLLKGAHRRIYRVSIFGVSILETPLRRTLIAALLSDDPEPLLRPPHGRPGETLFRSIRLDLSLSDRAVCKPLPEPIHCLQPFGLPLGSLRFENSIRPNRDGPAPSYDRGPLLRFQPIAQSRLIWRKIHLSRQHQPLVRIVRVFGKEPNGASCSDEGDRA